MNLLHYQVEQLLVQKNSQTVVASQKMQQSLRILQMNSEELNQYLSSQVEQNPFLEINDNAPSLDNLLPKALADDESVNHWQQESFKRYEKAASNVNFENCASDRKSLRQHLQEQIQVLGMPPQKLVVALQLLDHIDENGYLKYDLSDFCQQNKVKSTFVEQVVVELQALEPSGVFARDLKECIKIQLIDMGEGSEKLDQLLEHLDLVAKGEFEKLQRLLKISDAKLKGLISQIKKIDPKPGRNFTSDYDRYVLPEGIIYFDNSGRLQATLFRNYNQFLNVNHELYQRAISRCKSKDEKKFCKESLSSASWTQRAVVHRGETLLKVMLAIIEEQSEFFEKGVHYLKPMTLANIASKLSLHESTISRIANKYVITPFGTIELKSLFTNSIATNYSEDLLSTKHVKETIRQLIENEEKAMSDDEIAIYLGEKGVQISRRTVTKYRKAMGLSSSHLRKRSRKLAGL